MNKINVSSVFSEAEIDLMNKYVVAYGGETDHSPLESRVPFEQVLDKVWAHSKFNLYNLFRGELTLHKKVTVSTPLEVIRQSVNTCRELDRLYNQVLDMAHKLDPVSPLWYTNHCGRLTNYLYDVTEELICDSWQLTKNEYEYEESKEFLLPDGKTLKLTKGTKIIRFLGKLAKAYGFEEAYEAFRLKHSQILNTAKISGDLCLSIHPLDFMTMSHNACGWQSCMNWPERGCYRTGTVEMMNSPRVVVAYLESADKMTICDQEWNNKKWRTLVVLDNDYITTVKSYPYQHEELSATVAEWVAELANTAGANFTNAAKLYYCEEGGNFYIPKTDEDLNIEYETNRMYNDFGTGVYHAIVLSREALEHPGYKCINYSGDNQCIWCGKIREYNCDDNSVPAEFLVCQECGAPDSYCPCCDNWMYSSDLTTMVEGDLICRWCAENRTGIDYWTGERCYTYNLRRIYIANSASEIDTDNLFFDSRYASEGWDVLSKYVHEYTRWWTHYWYIAPDQIPQVVKEKLHEREMESSVPGRNLCIA